MTVRAIAEHANVNSALLGYYFENKETLARELIRSTSQRLEACRRESFDRLHGVHGAIIPIEALVWAFAEPFLLKKHPLRDDVLVYLSATTHFRGNPTDPLVSYARSINRDLNKTFLNEIERSLPKARSDSLHVRFEMMLGALVFTSTLAGGPQGLTYIPRAMFAGERLLTQFAHDWSAVFALPEPATSNHARSER
jgi:AcrR family transcriptional regulator